MPLLCEQCLDGRHGHAMRRHDRASTDCLFDSQATRRGRFHAMNQTTDGSALVLAAHGSATDSSVHQVVDGYVDRLAGLPQFAEVSAAFHLGEPSFASVLDQLHAQRVIVVPLMTSRGYFSDVVLPRELARNRRWHEVDLATTDPVGTHRDMASIVLARVGDCIKRQGFDDDRTSVIIVGHGTPRHADSSESTLLLAGTLRARHSAWDISAAFLDGAPTIEDALNNARRENVVVEPFLIADGLHASRDIPRRLGMVALDDKSPPITQRVGARTVVCDSAVGSDPGILDLITDLAVRFVERPRERADSSALAGRVETRKA